MNRNLDPSLLVNCIGSTKLTVFRRIKVPRQDRLDIGKGTSANPKLERYSQPGRHEKQPFYLHRGTVAIIRNGILEKDWPILWQLIVELLIVVLTTIRLGKAIGWPVSLGDQWLVRSLLRINRSSILWFVDVVPMTNRILFQFPAQSHVIAMHHRREIDTSVHWIVTTHSEQR